MEVFNSKQEFQKWRSSRNGSVEFVPTMGALHQGHAALLERAATSGAHAVLSIFVNPTQFGPTEDLSRYPRTLDTDLELARRAGVSAVFVPTVEEMYPNGPEAEFRIQPGPDGDLLCGAFRPGHFAGVCTVVAKLFEIVRPHRAYFGLKDYQQFVLLRRMVRALDLGISEGLELVGCSTVREADGLALSSRNRYLSADERERASALYRVLCEARDAIQGGEPPARAQAHATRALEHAGFRPQYVELWEGAVCAAAYLGTTRLIDNLILEPENSR